MEMTNRQIEIVSILLKYPGSSSSFVRAHMTEPPSLVTIKRELSSMLKSGYIGTSGGGRSMTYSMSLFGRLFHPIDSHTYNATDPDNRQGVLEQYEFDLWDFVPDTLFTQEERKTLDRSTEEYRKKSIGVSKTIHKRELERFVIEMSWKSSRIEGNTYTLLDTELLIKEGIVSKKNTKEETIMILNHKTAFDFVISHKDLFVKPLTIAVIEKVHRTMTDKLLSESGFRKHAVGITGSRYKPLDNQYQIKEALEQLIEKINAVEDVYSKALLIIAGISYIQPFADGNKRTARMLANAFLIASTCAPLSYRNVEENVYRGALLTFYEQLTLVPIKQLFIEQYTFAAKTYACVQ